MEIAFEFAQKSDSQSREGKISLSRLLYLTKNIDLDITEDCYCIVVTDVPNEHEVEVLQFLKHRTDFLIARKYSEKYLEVLNNATI